MQNLKKLGICFISIFLFFQSSIHAYSSDPREFITELVSDAINKLSDKNLSNKNLSDKICSEKLFLEYWRTPALRSLPAGTEVDRLRRFLNHTQKNKTTNV